MPAVSSLNGMEKLARTVEKDAVVYSIIDGFVLFFCSSNSLESSSFLRSVRGEESSVESRGLDCAHNLQSRQRM